MHEKTVHVSDDPSHRQDEAPPSSSTQSAGLWTAVFYEQAAMAMLTRKQKLERGLLQHYYLM